MASHLAGLPAVACYEESLYISEGRLPPTLKLRRTGRMVNHISGLPAEAHHALCVYVQRAKAGSIPLRSTILLRPWGIMLELYGGLRRDFIYIVS